MGTTPDTTRHYLDILCGAFMVRQLPPWFVNISERLVKSPKVYLSDSGIMHALLNLHTNTEVQSHPKLGLSWEGFAIEQITWLAEAHNDAYYYRTQAGTELDLLITRHGKAYGFEVKYEDAPKATRSMHESCADLSLERLWVVTPGENSYALTEKIHVVALVDVRRTLRDAGLAQGDDPRQCPNSDDVACVNLRSNTAPKGTMPCCLSSPEGGPTPPSSPRSNTTGRKAETARAAASGRPLPAIGSACHRTPQGGYPRKPQSLLLPCPYSSHKSFPSSQPHAWARLASDLRNRSRSSASESEALPPSPNFPLAPYHAIFIPEKHTHSAHLAPPCGGVPCQEGTKTMSPANPTIFNHTDFRAFLRESHEHLKSLDPKFSHRFISQQVGASSAGWFSNIISGRISLTGTYLLRLAKLLKLRNNEREYFELLVCLDQAGSLEEKNACMQKIVAVRATPMFPPGVPKRWGKELSNERENSIHWESVQLGPPLAVAPRKTPDDRLAYRQQFVALLLLTEAGKRFPPR